MLQFWGVLDLLAKQQVENKKAEIMAKKAEIIAKYTFGIYQICGSVEKNINFVKIGKLYSYEYTTRQDQRAGRA